MTSLLQIGIGNFLTVKIYADRSATDDLSLGIRSWERL